MAASTNTSAEDLVVPACRQPWASILRAHLDGLAGAGGHDLDFPLRGRELQFVDVAQKALSDQVKRPPRYALQWSDLYQSRQEATARLSVVVPEALTGILVLLVVMFGDIHLAG